MPLFGGRPWTDDPQCLQGLGQGIRAHICASWKEFVCLPVSCMFPYSSASLASIFYSLHLVIAGIPSWVPYLFVHYSWSAGCCWNQRRVSRRSTKGRNVVTESLLTPWKIRPGVLTGEHEWVWKKNNWQHLALLSDPETKVPPESGQKDCTCNPGSCIQSIKNSLV